MTNWQLPILALVAVVTLTQCVDVPTTKDFNATLLALVNQMEGRINKTQQQYQLTIRQLVHQIQMQQFHAQERIRSEGSSGLKQIRIRRIGSRNYYSESHTGRSIATMHDHSNNIRVVGLGDFIAVLNGVEFRTRHNDYSVVMPSTTSTELHKVEDLPYPDVPDQVKNAGSVADQVTEMREWLKAFVDQDHSVRDYRKYFKPIICYLEGAWFNIGDDDSIDESFQSDRHFLDASGWSGLHESAEFMAFSGSKSLLENLAMLPTAYFGMRNATSPQLAQWNFRILCHPISFDVPFKHLHVVDDLSGRSSHWLKPMDKYINTRAARFALNEEGEKRGTKYVSGLVDKIMGEVPGKDNYPGDIKGKSDDEDTPLGADNQPLNQAYYHRWYNLKKNDALGTNSMRRGFSDENLFAARTTSSRIAGKRFVSNKCKWEPQDCGSPPRRGCKPKIKVCPTKFERWSFAIPLELIYLTPLHNWNPYGITYNGWKALSGTGQCGVDKALSGSSRTVFYQTPADLFTASGEPGAGDTVGGAKCVLGDDGKEHRVVSSGVRVHLRSFAGRPATRIRYPVMPVHGEGNSMWKELNALRDLVMNKEKLKDLIYSDI